MQSVLEPTVGPILGSTTTTCARVLIRGALDRETLRRCHGVARVWSAAGGHAAAKLYKCKLNPNFDLTGVLVIDGLIGSTDYQYQVGWFFDGRDTEALELGALTIDWSSHTVHTFRTAAATTDASRSFIVGSCRYILRMMGGHWFDDRGDKTFRSIVAQLEGGERTDAVLMLGDQIYADDLNILSSDDVVDQFNARYRHAFTTPSMRALMARVPTYMTLDDHEIEDDWPKSASQNNYIRKFPAAMHAYQTYQLSHSPLFEVVDGGLEGTPNHLWYTFSDGCADVFMADTRTERSLDDGQRQMIGAKQFRALTEWLADGSGRIKFIASAVPLFGAKSSDKWEGFLAQRDQLLDFIFAHEIPKVVVLSGDVHASFSSELTSTRDPAFKVTSIVSSSFFWPYPHPLRSIFQKSGPLKSSSTNGYEIKDTSKVVNDDNFTRVTCDSAGLDIQVYGRKGDLLDRRQRRF